MRRLGHEMKDCEKAPHKRVVFVDTDEPNNDNTLERTSFPAMPTCPARPDPHSAFGPLHENGSICATEAIASYLMREP